METYRGVYLIEMQSALVGANLVQHLMIQPQKYPTICDYALTISLDISVIHDAKRCETPMQKLQEMRRRSKSNLVISGEKQLFVRSYQRSFELLLKNLGIPRRGFHALRHTFATRAIECGMDVKTLSETLGHKNASITLNRYVHSLMEHKHSMMDKVGKNL